MHSFLSQPFSLNRFENQFAQTIDRTHLAKEDLCSKILMDLKQANYRLASQTGIDCFLELLLILAITDGGSI